MLLLLILFCTLVDMLMGKKVLPSMDTLSKAQSLTQQMLTLNKLADNFQNLPSEITAVKTSLRGLLGKLPP